MSTIDKSASPSAAAPRELTRPDFKSPNVLFSSPIKQKQCLEECLLLKKGLSSTEKNCIIGCYQKTGMTRRKGLEI